MLRSKVVKKRTKTRETLLRNLRKGKARLEARCHFQTIPYPIKYVPDKKLYFLSADCVLMEVGNTIVLEESLLNSYKSYKQIQICDHENQKLAKVLVESRQTPSIDWRYSVDQLRAAETPELKEWAAPIRTYCERYENVVQGLEGILRGEAPSEIAKTIMKAGDKASKIRNNITRNFPYFEFKSQFKDGKLQLTEMIYNEKFLTELGHNFETFSTSVLSEGLPKLMPYEGAPMSRIARLRLEKYLDVDEDGWIGREVESYLCMKGGYLKKVKFLPYYFYTYEKGVPGYSIFITIVAKQKAMINNGHVPEKKPNPEFIKHMAHQEKEASEFLSEYYDEKMEMRYANSDKICRLKEL